MKIGDICDSRYWFSIERRPFAWWRWAMSFKPTYNGTTHGLVVCLPWCAVMGHVRDFGPVVSLFCSCCGGWTRGRQWHNRDKGHGLCPKCAEWIKSRKTDAEEMRRCYGVEGIHYSVKP